MGYFSSGSEGSDYEARYCARCAHGDGEFAGHCAVWEAHLVHNYRECRNDASILHVLIPRDTDGWNKECRLFIPRPATRRDSL